MFPEIGDIWMKDDVEYYMFLTTPNYSEDIGYAMTLCLNTGTREKLIFNTYNEEGWWERVA